MRPIHALLVVLAVLAAVGGAYFLIDADTSSAEVASAAPSAPSPDPERATEPSTLSGPELEGRDTGGERVAGAVAEPRPARAQDGPEAAATASRLAGRVVDPFGNAVAEATVYAAPETPWSRNVPLDALGDRTWVKLTEATTDANGRFELAVEDVARTRFAVRAKRFVPHDTELAVEVGGTRDVGNVVLEQSVVLTGRVVDPDRRGVAGAELRRLDEDGGLRFVHAGEEGVALATTDDNGVFEIDQLAAGPWRLGVTSEAHPEAVFQGETQRPGEVVSGLELVVEHGHEIAGRVTDAPPEALAEMHVVAYPDLELGKLDDTPSTRRSVPVAADGTFVVRGLRAGRSYWLQGREEPDERRMTLGGRSLTEAVTAEPGDRDVVLPHRPETALAFQVVDAETDEPLEHFDVAAGQQFPMPLRDDNGRSVTEHPEGRVRFANLRPTTGQDRAKLRIEAVGYDTFERDDLVLRAGVDNDLGTIRLEPAPTLTVRVLDEANRAPIERARVRIEEVEHATPGSFMSREINVEAHADGGDVDLGDIELPIFGGAQSARTDADGVAVLTSKPGKEVEIVVRANGYAPYKSAPIVLPEGKDYEYEATLGLGGTVVVRVVDPEGRPVAGQEVAHTPPGGASGGVVFGGAPKRTDAEGELTFENLEPGLHSFRAGTPENGTFSFSSGNAAFSMTRRVRGTPPREPENDAVEVEVVPGGSESIVLVAKARSGLVGRVTEAGMSLAGATVSLVEAGAEEEPQMAFLGGGGPESRTNGSGEYALDDVEVGEYTLRVTHPSRAMPYEQTVEVVDGGNELDVDLPTTVLRGRVTNTDGEPLAGVRVRPERFEGGGRRVVRQVMIMMTDGGDGEGQVLQGDGSFEPVVTDADGRYELRGVQPDVELSVRAEGDGVQPGSSRVLSLLPGDVVEDVDVELEPGGTLPVEVARADGSGASMCMITATYEGPEGREPKNGFTNKAGKATLDGLKPGPWKISARPMAFGGGGSGAEDPETVVEVVAGENEPARLRLP